MIRAYFVRKNKKAAAPPIPPHIPRYTLENPICLEDPCRRTVAAEKGSYPPNNVNLSPKPPLSRRNLVWIGG